MLENIEKFLEEFANAFREERFVKLTLGNYRGSDPQLQRVLIRLIETKKGRRLFFLFRYNTRDTAKNFDLNEGVGKLRELLGHDFFAGHLFTTTNDFQLDIGKKGKSRLNVAKPTFGAVPAAAHDREKKRFVRQESFYLTALGVTTESGEVRDKQQDKWKQINKFVETLSKLVENSAIDQQGEIRIVDMGCGKGYLTFATYDYFKNILGMNVKVIGVDAKTELVSLCNEIAKTSEFSDLTFVNGRIGEFEVGKVDILIALHACDTATDDAIFSGIKGGAELIVAAPCCHHEVRPQTHSPEVFSGILRHGIMLERTAETITDGLRSLLLEKSGYATKLFEFISVEHTPKNNMLAATKSAKTLDSADVAAQIDGIKSTFGISEQRLEKLLSSESTA